MVSYGQAINDYRVISDIQDKEEEERVIKSRLPIIMAERGIRTIADLSRRTGISRTALTTLYYGAGKGVSWETIETLCGFLNVGVGDLLVYVDDGQSQKGVTKRERRGTA